MVGLMRTVVFAITVCLLTAAIPQISAEGEDSGASEAATPHCTSRNANPGGAWADTDCDFDCGVGVAMSVKGAYFVGGSIECTNDAAEITFYDFCTMIAKCATVPGDGGGGTSGYCYGAASGFYAIVIFLGSFINIVCIGGAASAATTPSGNVQSFDEAISATSTSAIGDLVCPSPGFPGDCGLLLANSQSIFMQGTEAFSIECGTKYCHQTPVLCWVERETNKVCSTAADPHPFFL